MSRKSRTTPLLALAALIALAAPIARGESAAGSAMTSASKARSSDKSTPASRAAKDKEDARDEKDHTASVPDSRKVPVPRARPTSMPPGRSLGTPFTAGQATAHSDPGITPIAHAAAPTHSVPLAIAATTSTPPSDVDAVKRAIALVRGGRIGEATAAAGSISDPLARKLVEWAILRSDDSESDFARYNAFITANPGWPSIVTFRRRAEA